MIYVPLADDSWTNISYQKHPGSLLEGFSQTQVSTLAVRDNLLIAGGFQGELICKVYLSLGRSLLAIFFLGFEYRVNAYVHYRQSSSWLLSFF